MLKRNNSLYIYEQISKKAMSEENVNWTNIRHPYSR